MMKKISVFLLLGLVCFAQPTWRGLHFGMSEVDIRKEYSSNLRKVVDERQQLVLVDDNLVIMEPLNLHAKVSFSLGTTNKLEVINIEVNPAKNGEGTADVSSTWAITGFLSDQFLDKYGKPISEDGQCKPSIEDLLLPEKPISMCNKRWRYEGQVIKLFWATLHGCLTDLLLSYAPPPTDF